MNDDTQIQLSGPFRALDANGRSHEVDAIRIFDEGYGIIDVYVDLAGTDNDGMHEDPVFLRNILARLHALGYTGPDFGLGDPGLQDDKLIVLEAPEAFNSFAASKGWKNLAEEFADDDQDKFLPDGRSIDPKVSNLLDGLLRKFNKS